VREYDAGGTSTPPNSPLQQTGRVRRAWPRRATSGSRTAERLGR